MKWLAHFPARLPQGRSEFATWSDSIIVMARMPNNDSVKFALASMIPQLQLDKRGSLPMPRARVPKIYFVRALAQGAANQTALTIMTELKANQEKALKSEQQSAALEVVSGKETNI